MKIFIHVKSMDLLSKAKAKSKFEKFVNFPLTRIFIAILFIVPVILISNTVSFLYDSISDPTHSILSILRFIIVFFLLIVVYQYYTKLIEKRDTFELSKDNALFEWLIGFSTSLFLVGAMVLIMSVAGFYKIESTNSLLLLIKNFVFFGTGAFTQTLLFRIIVFRNVEELAGTWVALLVASLFFGFSHFFNQNATILTSLSLVFSEIMMIGAFVLTRRIWLVWGIHMGWNFFQAGLFGMPNSGIMFSGYFKPVITGPVWLTGGSFGIEASAVSFLMQMTLSIIIILLAIKQKQIIEPSWKRN